MTSFRNVNDATAGSTTQTASLFPSDGQFDQLRDFVDRAANGEIDLEIGRVQADGKLPSGWYAGPPDVAAPLTFLNRTRMRPEMFAGVLGLAAGLVLLLPFALWWQQSPSTKLEAAALTTSLAAEVPLERSAADARIDIVSVTPISVGSVTVAQPAEDEAVTEARSMLADGEVLATRALLSRAVEARNPAALFLLAETYDPNMLAAHRARGVGADTERARALYRAAQNLGNTRAAARLAALR